MNIFSIRLTGITWELGNQTQKVIRSSMEPSTMPAEQRHFLKWPGLLTTSGKNRNVRFYFFQLPGKNKVFWDLNIMECIRSIHSKKQLPTLIWMELNPWKKVMMSLLRVMGKMNWRIMCYMLLKSRADTSLPRRIPKQDIIFVLIISVSLK